MESGTCRREKRSRDESFPTVTRVFTSSLKISLDTKQKLETRLDTQLHHHLTMKETLDAPLFHPLPLAHKLPSSHHSSRSLFTPLRLLIPSPNVVQCSNMAPFRLDHHGSLNRSLCNSLSYRSTSMPSLRPPRPRSPGTQSVSPCSRLSVAYRTSFCRSCSSRMNSARLDVSWLG